MFKHANVRKYRPCDAFPTCLVLCQGGGELHLAECCSAAFESVVEAMQGQVA